MCCRAACSSLVSAGEGVTEWVLVAVRAQHLPSLIFVSIDRLYMNLMLDGATLGEPVPDFVTRAGFPHPRTPQASRPLLHTPVQGSAESCAVA